MSVAQPSHPQQVASRSPNVHRARKKESQQHDEHSHLGHLDDEWQMPKAGNSLYHADFTAKPPKYIAQNSKIDKELGLMFGYKPRPPTPPKWEKSTDYQNNFQPPPDAGRHERSFRNLSLAQENNFGATLGVPSLERTTTIQDVHRSPPRHAKASSTCRPSDAIGFPQGRATDFWLSQQRRDVGPPRRQMLTLGRSTMARSTSALGVSTDFEAAAAASALSAQAPQDVQSVLTVQEPDGASFPASEVARRKPAASTLSVSRPDGELLERQGSTLSAASPQAPRKSPKANTSAAAAAAMEGSSPELRSKSYRPLPEIRAPFSSPLRGVPLGMLQR